MLENKADCLLVSRCVIDVTSSFEVEKVNIFSNRQDIDYSTGSRNTDSNNNRDILGHDY